MMLLSVVTQANAYCPPTIDYSVRGEFGRADYVGVVRVSGVTWLDEQRRPTKLAGNLMLGAIRGGLDPYSGANYSVIPVKTFKGNASKPLVIFSENTEARTPLTIGSRYLVFLERQSVADEDRRVGDLMIDYCGNSSTVGNSRAALSIIQHAAAYNRLEKFLAEYINETNLRRSDLGYTAAFIDLNGDGKLEALVRLSGDAWCGSGGCTSLVLSRDGRSYRVISKVSITQLPIRALETSHHGWRDLGVTVAGGGIEPSYEAALTFNGYTYPGNPSVPPAKRLNEITGRILIGEDEAVRKLVATPAKASN